MYNDSINIYIYTIGGLECAEIFPSHLYAYMCTWHAALHTLVVM